MELDFPIDVLKASAHVQFQMVVIEEEREKYTCFSIDCNSLL